MKIPQYSRKRLRSKIFYEEGAAGVKSKGIAKRQSLAKCAKTYKFRSTRGKDCVARFSAKEEPQALKAKGLPNGNPLRNAPCGDVEAPPGFEPGSQGFAGKQFAEKCRKTVQKLRKKPFYFLIFELVPRWSQFFQKVQKALL